MRLRCGRNLASKASTSRLNAGSSLGQRRQLELLTLAQIYQGGIDGAGVDETTQRRATYACAKQGGNGGDAARAETRGVPPSPGQGSRWAGAPPTSPSKDRSPLLGHKTPSRRRTKQLISQSSYIVRDT